MKPELLLLIVTVLVALTFDFLNGFHDAANSIATVVSTRVLSPKLAVVWAAFFNFVAAFLLGTAVAKTIGGGMIHVESVTQYVVITGLFGAIVWDLLTWWWGLPTSSSHALIGGYAGAAVMRSGWHVIIAAGWYKTLIFIVVAPIMGLVLGWSFMVAVYWLLRNKAPQRIDVWFRKLQLLSAAAYSLGPWRQRCPEDDGNRGQRLLRRALLDRAGIGRQAGGNFTGPSFWRRIRRSRWGRISAAGGSFTPWARASPSSSRSAASAPSLRERSLSSPPRSLEFR